MTELEFLPVGVGGGFRVSRYKYLMPPHLDDFYSTSTGSALLANATYPLNGDFLETNRYEGFTCSTANISYDTNALCNANCTVPPETCDWNDTGVCNDNDLITCYQYEQSLNRYHAKTLNLFQDAVYIDSDVITCCKLKELARSCIIS